MAMTTVSSLSLDVAAHQKLMYYALRSELYFEQVADVKSTNLTNRGATVTFYITSDLAAATTPLTESSDVTPVAMSDSTVTLTLQEFGNAVQTSALVRATSFLEVNPVVSNVIGYNAGLSLDTVVGDVLTGGTNVAYSTGTSFATSGTEAAQNRLATTDNFNGAMVRYATAKLRGANVQPFPGGLYRGWMHPDVAFDFKGTTGGTNWSDPHIYSDPMGIYNGVVGAFQGVLWMEAPRTPFDADVGNGSGAGGNIDAYQSFVVGRQALAKAYSTGDDYGPEPVFVDSPVVDALRRFKGAGWKHLCRYGIFRQAAIWRLEAASSIGANT